MTGHANAGAGSLRFAIVLSLAAAAWPQAGGPTPPASAPQNQPEISTHEEKFTFTSHVNLVMVPVVVRDKQGHVVAGLTKEQFRLFDKGKLQEIDRFTVEKPGSAPPAAQPAAELQPNGESAAPPAALAIPRRFVGYLFDDVHADAADLMRARDAARRHVESQLKPTDRAAILTTSGQGMVDFTDDRGELRAGLERLTPHPIARAAVQECPDISYYQADLIINRNDHEAYLAAANEVIICRQLDPKDFPPEAQAMKVTVMQEAQRTLRSGEQETEVALGSLKSMVQRMSAMPGERVLVLVSPGFLSLSEHWAMESDLIERALRAKVIINVLNARGLYTTNIDASRAVIDSYAERTKQFILRQSDMAKESLLAEVAADTGGIYFHNNNDLDAGFRETASGPELYYLLGFQPQNLKLDGSLHILKVALEGKTGYSIEARRGYYAPTRLEDAAATAKREIEDAVFSTEEMNDLPVQLHTQFFRGAGDTATVTVLAHIDLAGVKFRKENGLNLDSLTVTSVLFDRNGKLVSGLQKHLDMRLLDATLEQRMPRGITMRLALEAPPGAYIVRLVTRDAEGQLMSALNGTVEIP